MKVKVIEDYLISEANYDNVLDEKINDFIKDKKVVDIKYQTFVFKSGYTGYPLIHQSALIMYEEGSDD